MSMKKPSMILIALVALLVFPAVGQAAAGPTRAHVDKRFGANGWAAIPAPRGTEPRSGETLCVAGPGSSYLVASTLYKSNRDVVRGGILVKLNSRGQRVKKFGRGGVLRFSKTNLPTDVHQLAGDASAVMFDQTRSSKKRWRLLKLLSNGKPDPSFGLAGALDFASSGGDPAVAWFSDGSFEVSQSSSQRFFTSDGQSDLRMNGTGSFVVPFEVWQIVPTNDGRFFATGRVGQSAVIAKYERNGQISADWSGGHLTTVDLPPEAVWRDQIESANSDIKATGISDPVISIVRSAPGFVDATFTSMLTGTEEDDGEVSVLWSIRFKPDGTVDKSRGAAGFRFEELLYDPDSLEAGDDEVWGGEYFLDDGRRVNTEFVLGSEQDPFQSAEVRVTDKAGRSRTRAARKFNDSSIVEYDSNFDSAGRYFFICGRRHGRLVAARVRF
jgi:hypothetical protein